MQNISANNLPKFQRRSFLHRHLRERGAAFMEMNKGAVPAAFEPDIIHEIKQAQRLGLSDLSCLARSGYKGSGAIEWLTRLGMKIGQDSNRAYPQEDGTLALRLSPTEILLIDDLRGEGLWIHKLEEEWRFPPFADSPSDGFPVPRQDSHFLFVLTGSYGAELMAKICGVDLRAHHFANYMIAQTMAAKIPVIIVRSDLKQLPVFFLLGDIASSLYFFRVLEDAAQEYQGGLIGYKALMS